MRIKYDGLGSGKEGGMDHRKEKAEWMSTS